MRACLEIGGRAGMKGSGQERDRPSKTLPPTKMEIDEWPGQSESSREFSERGLSAVHGNLRTGHPPRLVARQVDRCPGDVPRGSFGLEGHRQASTFSCLLSE